MTNKIGIIVPYRDRFEQLILFKHYITEYLETTDIDYEIIIVNQDDANLFNRGMLLNIGVSYAKKLGCNYVVLHDIDMLPVNVDYSYSKIPLHLATNFITKKGEKCRETFDQYFGGVTMFTIKDFEKINGFSNKYWGWGYEDDDLLLRCEHHHLPLENKKIPNLGRSGTSLKFNGINAYVKCKNIINFNKHASFFISFYPDKLNCSPATEKDDFTVFSIPGYNFAVSYTSFARYNFCTFDNNLNVLYVNSNIRPSYRTNIVIVLDKIDNIIKVYQDGNYIGRTSYFKKLYNYKTEPYFYLGVGNPNRDTEPNYFKGHIDTFAYYNCMLSEKQIKQISLNNEDLRNYDSSSDLKLYYDANQIEFYKLIDLCGKGNDGEIVACEIVESDFLPHTEISVPYRRNCTFKTLPHEENGFENNKWKYEATRWNQLRFVNEVSNHPSLLYKDGLSSLQFTEYGKINENNITHINVGI